MQRKTWLARVLAISLRVILSFLTMSYPSAAQSPSLAGSLVDQAAWRAYKLRFISAQGRVIDSGNGGISHSEGQGYGLLLAVAAKDRDAFERLWGWTRANLFVRGDALAAWRWEPNQRPAIADINNASDGDILLAWALTEAAEAWRDPTYRVAARRIAVEIGRKLVLWQAPRGPLLLPGSAGFTLEDRNDGPVVNLSYWVFPAFQRLALVAPEYDWAQLGRAGLSLLAESKHGPLTLAADWTALNGGKLRPAEGFPSSFAHNALRIPLYLAWGGLADTLYHRGFLEAVAQDKRPGIPVIDLASGRATASLPDLGYQAIVALAACAVEGRGFPESLKHPNIAGEDYYPVTLHFLSLMALTMRYPQCHRS